MMNRPDNGGKNNAVEWTVDEFGGGNCVAIGMPRRNARNCSSLIFDVAVLTSGEYWICPKKI